MNEQTEVYLVIHPYGGGINGYFDKERAHGVAKMNDGVVTSLPVIADYRLEQESK